MFSMFVDMRGSTKLSEDRLPFDIVFLISRFVEVASQAITEARSILRRRPVAVHRPPGS